MRANHMERRRIVLSVLYAVPVAAVAGGDDAHVAMRVVMQGTAHHLSRKVVHMAGGTAIRTEMGVWELDPAHSSVKLSVKHMIMTTVRGRFRDVQATPNGK